MAASSSSAEHAMPVAGAPPTHTHSSASSSAQQRRPWADGVCSAGELPASGSRQPKEAWSADNCEAAAEAEDDAKDAHGRRRPSGARAQEDAPYLRRLSGGSAFSADARAQLDLLVRQESEHQERLDDETSRCRPRLPSVSMRSDNRRPSIQSVLSDVCEVQPDQTPARRPPGDRRIIEWMGEDFPSLYAAEGEPCGFIPPLVFFQGGSVDNVARGSPETNTDEGNFDEGSSVCSSLNRVHDSPSLSSDEGGNAPCELPEWLAKATRGQADQGRASAADKREESDGSGSGFSDVSND